MCQRSQRNFLSQIFKTLSFSLFRSLLLGEWQYLLYVKLETEIDGERQVGMSREGKNR